MLFWTCHFYGRKIESIFWSGYRKMYYCFKNTELIKLYIRKVITRTDSRAIDEKVWVEEIALISAPTLPASVNLVTSLIIGTYITHGCSRIWSNTRIYSVVDISQHTNTQKVVVFCSQILSCSVRLVIWHICWLLDIYMIPLLPC